MYMMYVLKIQEPSFVKDCVDNIFLNIIKYTYYTG